MSKNHAVNAEQEVDRANFVSINDGHAQLVALRGIGYALLAINETLTGEQTPVEVPEREDYASPELYFVDGGSVYWDFGSVLFVAPVSRDGSIVWDDATEVDFYRIGPEDKTYCQYVYECLGHLEQARDIQMKRKLNLS